jgi:hypothetical protein
MLGQNWKEESKEEGVVLRTQVEELVEILS